MDSCKLGSLDCGRRHTVVVIPLLTRVPYPCKKCYSWIGYGLHLRFLSSFFFTNPKPGLISSKIPPVLESKGPRYLDERWCYPKVIACLTYLDTLSRYAIVSNALKWPQYLSNVGHPRNSLGACHVFAPRPLFVDRGVWGFSQDTIPCVVECGPRFYILKN